MACDDILARLSFLERFVGSAQVELSDLRGELQRWQAEHRADPKPDLPFSCVYRIRPSYLWECTNEKALLGICADARLRRCEHREEPAPTPGPALKPSLEEMVERTEDRWEEEPHVPDAEPIEDVLRRICKDIPQEEWDKLPDDLTDNLDHYLYGTPKDKPAQRHGYEVGDVVAHLDNEGEVNNVGTITGFETGFLQAALVGEPGAKVTDTSGDDRCFWWFSKLTPVHRCPAEDYCLGCYPDECRCGDHTRDKMFFLPNPSGAPGKSFLACSEEPLPVGTWIAAMDDLWKIVSVPTPKEDLSYKVWGNAGVIWHTDVVDSRLPPDAIICETCKGAYVLPKEETNA